MCPCNEGEQSVEHLIHACRILEPQRSSLIQHKYNYQRRDLAPHKQRTCCQIFKRLLTICQIYRFQQIVID